MENLLRWILDVKDVIDRKLFMAGKSMFKVTDILLDGDYLNTWYILKDSVYDKVPQGKNDPG